MPGRRARADVQPVTWEVPVAGAASWLLLVLLFLPASQGAAGWLLAGGFVWPHGSKPLMQSIGGLITGQPGRGLTGQDATHLASTPSIYLLVVFGELALSAVTVWVIVAWWRYMGPGVQQGMADRSEVERVLGVSNLGKKRGIIRPDLHPRQARTTRSKP
jgi:hypothetical protein